jgi:hypothetical protein
MSSSKNNPKAEIPTASKSLAMHKPRKPMHIERLESRLALSAAPYDAYAAAWAEYEATGGQMIQDSNHCGELVAAIESARAAGLSDDDIKVLLASHLHGDMAAPTAEVAAMSDMSVDAMSMDAMLDGNASMTGETGSDTSAAHEAMPEVDMHAMSDEMAASTMEAMLETAGGTSMGGRAEMEMPELEFGEYTAFEGAMAMAAGVAPMGDADAVLGDAVEAMSGSEMHEGETAESLDELLASWTNGESVEASGEQPVDALTADKTPIEADALAQLRELATSDALPTEALPSDVATPEVTPATFAAAPVSTVAEPAKKDNAAIVAASAAAVASAAGAIILERRAAKTKRRSRTE